jgi:hypothetical protein
LRENRKHWNEGKLERKKKERVLRTEELLLEDGWIVKALKKEKKEGTKKEGTYVIDENFYCLCCFFSIFRFFSTFFFKFLHNDGLTSCQYPLQD